MQARIGNLIITAAVVLVGVQEISATTYYVNGNGTSGNDAYSGLCEVYDPNSCQPICCGPRKTIQAGITATAADFDVVIVAPVFVEPGHMQGTYTGAGNRDLTTPVGSMPPAARKITVRCTNGPGSCIIDCQATAGDRHRGFVFDNTTHNNNASHDVVVQGFTIKNGYSPGNVNGDGKGGGIWIKNSSPTIRQCIIRDCTASPSGSGIGEGGGIAIEPNLPQTVPANPLIEYCLIEENYAMDNGGGISVGDGGSLTLNQSTIKDCIIRCNKNENVGGGLFFKGTSKSVVKNTFIGENDTTLSGNKGAGGGIGHLGVGLDLSIANCTIVNNLAKRNGCGPNLNCGGGGIGLFGNGTVRVINTLVAWNEAHDGGGIGVDTLVPTRALSVEVHDCTIADNLANTDLEGGHGGGIDYCKGNSLIVDNSIVYWNDAYSYPNSTDDDNIYEGQLGLSVAYTDVQRLPGFPIWPGAGNIKDNPQFVARTGADGLKQTWLDNNYRLSLIPIPSLCRNAGSNSLIPQDITDVDDDGVFVELTGHPWDLDKQARRNAVDGDFVDMGAYEFRTTCPVDTIAPTHVSTVPRSGTVDARQPNAVNDLSPRWGIGYPLTTSPTDPDRIRIKLTGGSTTAGNVACWRLCETKAYLLEKDEFSVTFGGPNAITAVTHLGNGVYEVTLKRAITAGEVTRINYGLANNSYVEYFAHPANANGDSAATAADITALQNYLADTDCPNGPVCTGPPPCQPSTPGCCCAPHGIYSMDINHSGAANAQDIPRLIDLLNGASTFDPWLNSAKPTFTECICPVVGMAMGAPSGPGAGPSAADEAAVNQIFMDGVVEFLVTANPVSSSDEQDIIEVAEALTGWSLDHLSLEERKELTAALEEPLLTFASKVAAELVPDIVAKLSE